MAAALADAKHLLLLDAARATAPVPDPYVHLLLQNMNALIACVFVRM